MLLPEELVNAILLNLPLKDIPHYKCVCKSWCSLIIISPSPTFIYEYQKVSDTKNPNLLVKYRDIELSGRKYPLISFICHETLEVVVDGNELHFSNTDAWTRRNPPPKNKKKKSVDFKDVSIVGCCNGVVLFLT